MDQNIQEIKNNLDVMIQSFDDNQPVIVVTDIPGGSTTQTAIQRISDNKHEFRISNEFIFFITFTR